MGKPKHNRVGRFERIGDYRQLPMGIQLVELVEPKDRNTSAHRPIVDLSALCTTESVRRGLVFIANWRHKDDPAPEQILIALFPGWKCMIEEALLDILADEVRDSDR